MRRRVRGITLVELLVVIALFGVIMSAVATCLHSMYRADRRTRESMAGRSTLGRLSLRFRADAHSAADVIVEGQAGDKPPSIVFFRPAGETVEYRSERTHVLRIVSKDKKETHRDAFRLPRRTRVEWQAGGDERFVSMVVHYMPESDDDEATRQQRIEAVVGLHNVANQSSE